MAHNRCSHAMSHVALAPENRETIRKSGNSKDSVVWAFGQMRFKTDAGVRFEIRVMGLGLGFGVTVTEPTTAQKHERPAHMVWLGGQSRRSPLPAGFMSQNTASAATCKALFQHKKGSNFAIYFEGIWGSLHLRTLH